MRLRNDWQKHIGSLPSTTYGGQGPQYNFTAVTIPECLPERLEIVAYIMEFAFLHDDLVDQAEASEGLGFFEKMMKEIKAGFRSTDRRQGSSGESRILGDIFEEMMAVDSPRAKQFLEYWKRGPISSPSSYINALPSKNIRDKAADALNVWLNVPQADLSHIKRIVNMLHNASLMLDDMEDGSTLRRGSPAAHTIFGIAQTMNSAGWQVVEATREIQKLNDDSSIEMCMEELINMYIGQGHDIFWATNVVCPSLDEYLKMVDYKTGGLFRILTRLMLAKSPTPPWSDLTAIASLMGRYFQVRDDYMNLSSADYTKKKGFCEDLDEGKFSLLMIHTMQAAPEVDRMLLQNLLAQRRAAGKMSMAQKHLILEIMKKTGSMEYVAKVLEALLAEVRKMVDDVDKECGIENEMMRSLLGSLGVEAPLL
ncbi:hypothetical protein SLS60_008338 [Paraconiothyrium brasiliense]|uniref:geranylgeranyl diphosphate synthase n=1 Tax=Paraconiothyrium brasiliense TaxID=300254 RepID=A0ABR3R0A7_9PLEO